MLRPTLAGEELYNQSGFLFRQFWPIDILFVEHCEGALLENPSRLEYIIEKIFQNFVFNHSSFLYCLLITYSQIFQVAYYITTGVEKGTIEHI